MFDRKLNPVVIAVDRVGRLTAPKQIGIGVILGMSVMVAGYAVSASNGGSTLGNASSELISQQSSVVAENIRADAETCATGTQDGTIGYSIKQALDIHTELAAATPNVEALFDVSNDCFSGLSQIFDLSFSIPSLSSIVSAAQQAVLQYAEKKVCTAVNQVSGMVTSPINQAIGKVSGMSSFGDLNGLTNGLVKQGMSEIDPNLGGQYHSGASGGTYNVNTNPFNSSQTDFGGSSGTTGNDIGTANAQINALNQQIANVQAQVGPTQYQLQQAQQQLSGCQAYQYNNCTSYQQAVTSAQSALNNLNQQLASLGAQLTAVSSSAYSGQGAQSVQGTSTAPQSSGNHSFIESIGKLFN